MESKLHDPGTPLQYAAYYTLGTVLHVLLLNGADPNPESKMSMFGNALIAAIYSIDKALEKGGSAIQHGLNPQLAVVGTLLKRNTNPNTPAIGTFSGFKTPLEAACRIYKSHSCRIGMGIRPIEQVITILHRNGARHDPMAKGSSKTHRGKRR